MKFQTTGYFTLILVAVFLASCQSAVQASPENGAVPLTATASPTSDASLFLTRYLFPASFDPTKHYMFYLHGKITEDQGIPAVSPDFGRFEYEAILEKLASHDFIVISEQRPKDTDSLEYAGRVAGQVTELLKAGVPSENISIVGTSKGAAIAIGTSNYLANNTMNFILLGSCYTGTVQFFKQQNFFLYGNVLAIRDAVDNFAGPCDELFAFSDGKITRHEEIVLHIGTGHGILYQPLDEWILPTVQWARP